MSLTKADFEKYDWQHIIEDVEEKVCHQYANSFRGEMEKSEEDKIRQELFALLQFISILFLNPQDARADNEPFGANQYGIEQLSENYLSVLEEIMPNVKDAEMRARIADIVWIRQPKRHNIATVTVSAYVLAAKHLAKTKNWLYVTPRLARALQIGVRFGRKNPPFMETIEYIKELLRGDDDIDDFVYVELLQLLYENDEGDAAECATIAGKHAAKAEALGKLLMASRFWESKARWEQRAGNADGERSSWIEAAEAYVRMSEGDARTTTPEIAAPLNLHIAIQLLRKTTNTRQRADELHALILEYQKKNLETMEHMSTSIDIAKYVQQAQDRVKGKPLHKALLELTFLCSSPPVDSLRSLVEQGMKNHQLLYAFPKYVFNESGRVTHHRPSISFSSPEEAEAGIIDEMYSYATMRQDLSTQGLILPALQQIMQEHYITYNDFAWLAEHSPFVAPGREELFARGMYAGLNQDFMIAAHLLIPQIEHSIRYILAQQNLITTSIDIDGVQKEYNLNTCLEEPRFGPKLAEIFGPDIIFDLQGLLVKPAGSNLRNIISHGLVSSIGFTSLRVVYLWWLTLKLSYMPVLARMQTPEPPKPAE